MEYFFPFGKPDLLEMKLTGSILSTLIATGQGTSIDQYLNELRIGCTNVISSSRFDERHPWLTRDEFVKKWTNKDSVIKTEIHVPRESL